MNAVIQLTTAARVLAQLRAKAAVKDAIRRQGLKPSSLTAAEIRGWADLYVEDHPALVAEARERARAMILEGLLGKRAQRALGANITQNVQNQSQPISRVSAVQMSGANDDDWIRPSIDDGQTLDAQQAALRGAGCERPYAEKVSGAKTDRAALAKAIAALADGDCLIVTKLDRLARSTRDLLNTLATISDKGATFRSLGDSWADTTTPHGRLMLTVLGGLAEFERHLILARTSEGRTRAQARGVRFGRKLKLSVHQRQEALARRAAGEALVDIARSYAVSHSTISRLA